MPKEFIRSREDDSGLEIGWSKDSEFAQIGVRLQDGEYFQLDGNTYNSLFFDLTPESLDQTIKVLQKIRRQKVLTPQQ